MRASSLALRLFLSATAWTVVILVATGIFLSSIYREAVERSFDRRLSVYLQTLVAELLGRGDAGRAAVRPAAFRLVLAGDPARCSDAGGPLVTLPVG